MSIKHIALSAFVVALLSISSCIVNDRSLGEQLVSDDYLLKVKDTVLYLPISNKMLDSIQSYSSTSMIFGYMSDPTFGTTSISTASYVVPVSDSTDLGISPRLKDIYVNLVIDSTKTFKAGYEGIAQNIYIYKLNRTLDSTTTFNTSLTAADYDPIPISIGSPVYYGGDSIKIHLSEEYGKILLETTPEEFDSLGLFMERVKGVYITTDAPDIVEHGGRLNYLPLSTSCIYVDYVLNDPERDFVDHDTTEVFALGYAFALNATIPGSAHLANDNPGDILYVEGMGGIKPYISGVDFKAAIDRWMKDMGYQGKNVIFSRASLEFPYEMPDDYTKVSIEYPAQIFPCCTPSALDSAQYVNPLSEIYTNTYVGEINRSLMKYTCDITSYVQFITLMEAKEVNKSFDLWISPVNYFEEKSSSSSSSSYYDPYSYYYNPYMYSGYGYGGYGYGYGGYGYGGYPYGYGYGYGYGSSSSSSTTSAYYAFDNFNYSRMTINGPTSARRPYLKLTYSVLNY